MNTILWLLVVTGAILGLFCAAGLLGTSMSPRERRWFYIVMISCFLLPFGAGFWWMVAGGMSNILWALMMTGVTIGMFCAAGLMGTSMSPHERHWSYAVMIVSFLLAFGAGFWLMVA